MFQHHGETQRELETEGSRCSLVSRCCHHLQCFRCEHGSKLREDSCCSCEGTWLVAVAAAGVDGTFSFCLCSAMCGHGNHKNDTEGDNYI